MAGRICVTGASGFVGSAVVKALRSHSYTVNALVNRKNPFGTEECLEIITGDLFDPATLQRAMLGCQAVIHLVGIIRENRKRNITFDRIHVQGTQAVVTATKEAGINRYIHMSALGSRPGAASEYHRTKYQAEEFVRQSGLDWTIFRPSLIHGSRGEFMQMEAKWARRKAPPFLFMPYFGAGLLGHSGAGKLQPILVDDVARLFVDAMNKPETAGEIYPIAGPDQLTWPQLHHICSEEIVGKPRAVMPIPAWFARFLTAIVPASLLPFNHDQIIMSQEDNTTDLSKVSGAFGFAPQSFRESLKTYVREL